MESSKERRLAHYRRDPAVDLINSGQISSEFNEYLQYFLELQKIRASKRVLVVEDDPISLLALRNIVKNYNGEIKCFLATDIDEAMDVLQREKCDLVITDYYLSPSQNGVELWELVRQQFPDVEVVITSGIGHDRYREIVKNMEFPPMFFDKPFSPEKFNGFFKDLFGGSQHAHK